ncbi:MAG: hypothetical protein IH991_02695 [Planctomycetes bacterium]|nr:hypothetical protein [Planctomycetota bacterium]
MMGGEKRNPSLSLVPKTGTIIDLMETVQSMVAADVVLGQYFLDAEDELSAHEFAALVEERPAITGGTIRLLMDLARDPRALELAATPSSWPTQWPESLREKVEAARDAYSNDVFASFSRVFPDGYLTVGQDE